MLMLLFPETTETNLLRLPFHYPDQRGKPERETSGPNIPVYKMLKFEGFYGKLWPCDTTRLAKLVPQTNVWTRL